MRRRARFRRERAGRCRRSCESPCLRPTADELDRAKIESSPRDALPSAAGMKTEPVRGESRSRDAAIRHVRGLRIRFPDANNRARRTRRPMIPRKSRHRTPARTSVPTVHSADHWESSRHPQRGFLRSHGCMPTVSWSPTSVRWVWIPSSLANRPGVASRPKVLSCSNINLLCGNNDTAKSRLMFRLHSHGSGDISSIRTTRLGDYHKK